MEIISGNQVAQVLSHYEENWHLTWYIDITARLAHRDHIRPEIEFSAICNATAVEALAYQEMLMTATSIVVGEFYHIYGHTIIA